MHKQRLTLGFQSQVEMQGRLLFFYDFNTYLNSLFKGTVYS